jgi:hypothetical protein
MVGDDDPVQLTPASDADKLLRGSEGVFGGGGVGMEVDG